MNEKRRLGKGLGALIPEAVNDKEGSNEIELDLIKANPFQPRRDFDEDKMKELASSIKEHGILQAVVVSPDPEGEGYILVAGERRCRAARMVGLKKVPAVIKKINKKTMLEMALIENLQREDLNPLEEAAAYRRLIDDFKYTQEELAGRLGKSRPTVANSLRLLSLTEPVRDLMASRTITAGQARPLLSIEEPGRQYEAAMMIVEQGLSARAAEKLAAKKGRAGIKKDKDMKNTDPLIEEIQQRIQRALGTKVKIKSGREGGTIEIYYYGDDDLERLTTRLLPEGLD
ncbi:MAG: ParB/RepB/Spo0J family partition protein [Bacillota bacterium]